MRTGKVCLLCFLLVSLAACVSAELSRAREDLKAGSVAQRLEATRVLGNLNESAAIPTLMLYLNEKQPLVRDAVIAALGKKGAAAVEVLVKAVRTGGPDERSGAARALALIGRPAYESVLSLSTDTNPDIQVAAIRVLGEIGDDRVVPHLLQRLGSENNDVRRSAVEALGHFGEPRIFDAVFPLLKDPAVRDVIGDALGKSGSTQVAKLAASLKDQPLDIRLALLKALGKTRSADALPVLQEQLLRATAANYPFSDEDTKIKEQSEHAMCDLGSAAVAPLIEILRRDGDGWLTSAAGTALTSATDESTVQLLIDELLSWRSDSSGLACAMSLSQIAGRDDAGEITKLATLSLDGILAALRSEKAPVREMAAFANHHNPVPRVRQQLLSAFEQRDLAVVKGAYKFFIQRGIAGSEETLIAALNDSDSMLMADAYLNCGNGKLVEAARAWAPRHGYVVNRSDSPSILRWGVR